MITKTVEPIINEGCNYKERKAIGMRAEYRIFGILVYKKVYYTHAKYGITSWEVPCNF